MATAAEFIAWARYCHQAGNLRQAEDFYCQALQAEPHNADIHHFLGVIACQTGRYEQAIVSIRQAVALNATAADYHIHLGLAYAGLGQWPDAVASYQNALLLCPEDADAHYNLGIALHYEGRLAEAVDHYRQTLALNPNYGEAHNNLGGALASQGRFDQAVAHYQQALLLQPNNPQAHNNLGNAWAGQGKIGEAVASYQRALRLQPNFAEAHTNLGMLLAKHGRDEEAVAHFQQAAHLQPDFAESHCNLGKVLISLGRRDEALASLQRALQLRPDFPEAHNHLGMAWAVQGNFDQAEASYRRALTLKPDFAEAHNNLGNVLVNQGKLDEAVTSLEQALRLKPDFAEAHWNLGVQLEELGRVDEAQTHLQQAFRLQPRHINRVVLATLLPAVYQSMDDLLTWRQRLTDQVQRMHDEGMVLDLAREKAVPVFFLVYQGFNDRDLQGQLAGLYVAPPEVGRIANPSYPEKIRIGFISCHFKDHNIATLMGGLITELSREIFSVTVLSIGAHADATSQWLHQHADNYVVLPRDPRAARPILAEQHLDVLFYTDIGMDETTYSLAFSRLAPVQCVTWGHGITTGIPAMDYFISSVSLDSAASAQHYSEQLVRLKNVAVHYSRPVAPTPLKRRDYFGLPTSGALYACPQSLFKFHPDFDAVLAGILRRDQRGTLVLLEGKYPRWTELLQQRFAKVLPDVQERIRFLPRQKYQDFLNLCAIADVLLDPFPCSGGNTSYEGLALAAPIVTMPPPLMRGRVTFALYSQMGVMDCVASNPAEYVNLAVKLGTDADWRAAVRAKITAAKDVLFENNAGIRELEQFLQVAVRRARAGLPPAAWP